MEIKTGKNERNREKIYTREGEIIEKRERERMEREREREEV